MVCSESGQALRRNHDKSYLPRPVHRHQRIRAQAWGRGMRLVALTGWGQDLDRQRTRESGIDAHLVKPVELEDLLAALQADTAVV